MYKRNWLTLGRIQSDEGFSVYYGHKTFYYVDQRGTLQIGYEVDLLFPSSLCWVKGNDILFEPERAVILDRMLQALEWDGHPARLWTSPE